MKKLFSLLIAVLMIISISAYAEVNDLPADIPESGEVSVPAEAAAPGEESAPTETAEPVEEGAAEEAAGPAEEGMTEETAKPAEETAPEEAAEPVEETVPEEAAEPAEETVPEETAEPAEETAPEETAEPAEEGVTEETAEPAEEGVTEEAAEPAEEAAPAEAAEPAEETVPEEAATVPEEATVPAEAAEPAEETASAEAAVGVEEAAPVEAATPVEEAVPEEAAAPVTEATPEETTETAEAAPDTEPEEKEEPGTEPADEPKEDSSEQPNETPEQADVLGAATFEAPVCYEAADVLTEAAATADILPASDYAKENSVRGFVYRLYRTVLQREPDESGFLFWVRMLDSGSSTAAEVVDGFFNSDEYRNSKKTNAEIIKDCYNTMLNRDPDDGGFQYWNNRLTIGMTPQSILAGFVESNEFSKIASQYGVVRGDIVITDPRDKNYERTYFVYRLYQNCLARDPDAAGIYGWCFGLENGLTGIEAASGFFFSDEFNRSRFNNSTFVQKLYKAILGREYDVEGLMNWTTKLNYSDTREKVLNGFIGSAEFARQCQAAGILPGDPIYEPDNSEEWKYNIKVLHLCNEQRRLAGLADLYTREDLLWDLAMARAEEITKQFSHTRPDGTSCFVLFKQQGFYGYLGENLAAGKVYRDPNEVVKAWMESQGHRENILNPNYTYLATGLVNDPYAWSYCAEGSYKGQYVDFGIYSAQAFCNYGVKIK